MYFDFSICSEPKEYHGMTLDRIFYINGDQDYNTPVKNLSPGKVYFVFTVQGEGIIEFDGKTTQVRANTCMFMEPARDFSYRCKDNCWEFWWFEFFGSYQGTPNLLTPVIPDALFQPLLNKSLQCTKIGDWELSTSLFQSFLLLVSRNSNRTLHSFNNENFVQVIERYIRDHIKSVTVGDLCEEFNTQERTLRNIFNKTLGLSPKQFIMKTRLEFASELLISTHNSLMQISLECGFANQYHLSKAFKEHFGVSPAQYRKYIVLL